MRGKTLRCCQILLLLATNFCLLLSLKANAPIVPEKDPPLDEPPVRLRPEVANVHPRLLFGPEDLPRLRANYQHPSMKIYRKALLGYLNAARSLPQQFTFLTDATDAQRHGLWRIPTLAYHYLMTGDEASLRAAIDYMRLLEKLEHWEMTRELDSGMGAANIMIGAALAFDWLYDRLEPEFRERFRRKLIEMARRMYYGGHLMRNPGPHYWQQDPQNNHRWHRNAGLLLAVLAAYRGEVDDWILTKAAKEVQFVVNWLPEDGSSHESPTYLIFGGSHLLLAVEASDRCLGTRLLEHPFFKSVGHFWAQTVTPGLDGFFYYGDSAGEPGKGYLYFLYRLASHFKQYDIQALLDVLTQRGVEPNNAWFALMWRDPELVGGRIENLPKRAVFPDLGLVILREGWDKGCAGLMFKCGPLGGLKLNEFRNANAYRYINVAHDDPDANSFVLYKNGALLAETDRYSYRKFSGNHNTILVNGRGQAAIGRSDVSHWNQPATGSTDMTKQARLMVFKDEGEIVIVEGEAGGAYPPLKAEKDRKASPGLERFRRTIVWVEGQYVLILDDVRVSQPADISWLIQAKRVETVNPEVGRYIIAHENASANLQIVSDEKLDSEVVDSPADDRGKPLGWKQLRVHARNAKEVRFATVIALWGKDAKISLQPIKTDAWEVVIKLLQGEDRWVWVASTSPEKPYRLEGLLHSGKKILSGE